MSRNIHNKYQTTVCRFVIVVSHRGKDLSSAETIEILGLCHLYTDTVIIVGLNKVNKNTFPVLEDDTSNLSLKVTKSSHEMS